MDPAVEDTPALVLGSENSHDVSYDELKKPFSKVWESYLKMKHDPSEYKRILVILDEKVNKSIGNNNHALGSAKE